MPRNPRLSEVAKAVSRISAEKADMETYAKLAYDLLGFGLEQDARLVMGISNDEARHHGIMMKVKADLERMKSVGH